MRSVSNSPPLSGHRRTFCEHHAPLTTSGASHRLTGTHFDPVLTTSLNELIVGIQQRLAEQLPAADQNGWISGRPLTITPLDQQTVELVFHGVPQVSEAEVRAVRRVLEMPTFCSVSPETAGTLRVTFLCHVP
jgi:hypothetical protein